jgi:hypothetical protein
VSGIKVALSEVDPKTFHSGDKVKLKLELPDPWKTIHCFGNVRKAWTSPDDPKMLVLGIKFINLSLIDLKKLREYMYGDTHIEE